jgi:hypothetical protein
MSVEAATVQTLEHLRAAGKLEGREALAELALTLARTLDGDPGLVVAAVSRELRATLMELGKPHDSVGDEAESWLAGLSSAVGDAEDESPDLGPEGR